MAIIRLMAFKLSLITLVYPNEIGDSELNVALLQKANAWLQRRNAKVSDDLLLIGVGFDDEVDFQATLKPYGLASAEIDVIPPDAFDQTDGAALGESVESIAASWISKHHGNAIPVVSWGALVPDAAYPADGWWWVGLEAKDDEQSSLADILNELLPDAFKKQALAWVTLFAECDGFSAYGEEHETHEATLKTVALARWLIGFDAATENNFYDFSASDAIDTAGLDALRLGFEAGRNHEVELGNYFDGDDQTDEGLAAACLKACLDERNAGVRDALSTALGGNAALFWSLHTSIWPDLKKPMHEAMDDLLNLRMGGIGDLERPWMFVTDGWIDFAEE